MVDFKVGDRVKFVVPKSELGVTDTPTGRKCLRLMKGRCIVTKVSTLEYTEGKYYTIENNGETWELLDGRYLRPIVNKCPFYCPDNKKGECKSKKKSKCRFYQDYRRSYA
jgi:hypothetical protein